MSFRIFDLGLRFFVNNVESSKNVQKQPYFKRRQLSLLFAVATVTSAIARAVSSNVEIAPRIYHGFTFCLL